MNCTPNSLIVRALMEKKISILTAIPTCCYNEIERTYVSFIRNFLNDYNVLPTLELFQESNPLFRTDVIDKDIPTKYIFDQVSNNLVENYINSNKNNIEPGYTQRAWLQKLLDDSRIKNLDLIEYTEFNREEYLTVPHRVYFGVPWFDQTFGGAFGGEITFLFGRMKSMKTTVLQLLTCSLLNGGHKVLSISQEMSTLKFTKKMDAFGTGLDPSLFRESNFDEEQWEKVVNLQRRLSNKHETKGRLLIGSKVNDLSDLRSLIYNAQDRPQIVMVDAVELIGKFDVSNYHLSLAGIAYGLQAIALDYNIPIVGTLQANRGSGSDDDLTLERVAGSDAFARACEALLSVKQFKENNKTYVRLETLAYRDGELKTTYIRPDFRTMKFHFMDFIDQPNLDDQFEKDVLYGFSEAKNRIAE